MEAKETEATSMLLLIAFRLYSDIQIIVTPVKRVKGFILLELK